MVECGDFLPSDSEGRRKILIVLWIVILIWSLCFNIASFVAAGKAGGSYAFPVVWTALLLLGFVIGSYLVMKKYQTPLAYGFLVGTAFMLTNMMLNTAIMFGQVRDYEAEDYKSAADAITAFSCLLFLCMAVYTWLLVLWRDDMINDDYRHDQIPSGISSSTPVMQSGIPVSSGIPSYHSSAPYGSSSASAADSYQGVNAAL
eukprot:TRINITY_DN727_c0_g1::TRINITY_DN727_c0_g1_i1::g.18479::m.18479 TRINITY_DN727_c0_g1::TRINITY_DN727_c0_g1_i1::g.18479  ORF type:complete len:202 (+),score=52.27,DUF1084/PF06454.6/2.7,DUF1084/PF06454.6/0.62,DUF3792/PF12670.2/0.013,DUF3792/PF12670.2/5e+03,Glyco_transf_21/PF13506.1/2.7,DUF3278/PF11683.3/8.1,DUF3278/PF11683.3/0.36,DUF4131/PF13567.1/16,DUF4131/PF13567.1/2.8 TRINITY_DN727_c0_g1_i1:61-666(+)